MKLIMALQVSVHGPLETAEGTEYNLGNFGRVSY